MNVHELFAYDEKHTQTELQTALLLKVRIELSSMMGTMTNTLIDNGNTGPTNQVYEKKEHQFRSQDLKTPAPNRQLSIYR